MTATVMYETKEPPSNSWTARLLARCPACRAVIGGVRTSPNGMVGYYACGAEYLEGLPPKRVKGCSRVQAKR